MEVLWGHIGELTARLVHRALGEHDLAYTTIIITMVRLCEKGMLSRATMNAGIERGGRGVTYRYTAAVDTSAPRYLIAAAIPALSQHASRQRPDSGTLQQWRPVDRSPCR